MVGNDLFHIERFPDLDNVLKSNFWSSSSFDSFCKIAYKIIDVIQEFPVIDTLESMNQKLERLSSEYNIEPSLHLTNDYEYSALIYQIYESIMSIDSDLGSLEYKISVLPQSVNKEDTFKNIILMLKNLDFLFNRILRENKISKFALMEFGDSLDNSIKNTLNALESVFIASGGSSLEFWIINTQMELLSTQKLRFENYYKITEYF